MSKDMSLVPRQIETCKKLFNFEPSADVMAKNSKVIDAIIVGEEGRMAADAFYSYVITGNHEYADDSYPIRKRLKESDGILLMMLFRVPYDTLQAFDDCIRDIHAAYNFYTGKVLDEKYPHSSKYSGFLLMLCKGSFSVSSAIEHIEKLAGASSEK